TTYPSYALNLAQLGALCISNLCATKPFIPAKFPLAVRKSAILLHKEEVFIKSAHALAKHCFSSERKKGLLISRGFKYQ
ncbi:hypothetical protein, partial [Acinetobacter pseudolwoffii]|uniref:hypothetical protein n=1 Tax=Acinetobacter pseudolwoffii TaxID=2053287 RepID=UPI002578BB72